MARVHDEVLDNEDSSTLLTVLIKHPHRFGPQCSTFVASYSFKVLRILVCFSQGVSNGVISVEFKSIQGHAGPASSKLACWVEPVRTLNESMLV